MLPANRMHLSESSEILSESYEVQEQPARFTQTAVLRWSEDSSFVLDYFIKLILLQSSQTYEIAFMCLQRDGLIECSESEIRKLLMNIVILRHRIESTFGQESVTDIDSKKLHFQDVTS
eukprot:TRINITY_DN8892_c0_g1::TRINITY_DN8892_c0_g1_i1::g.19048::m.19048 TRINITY_DN8892_c0_g1::TRINITY_DN8892_c0_g1_i1::g.19048  ORF type:complete len:119 (-),score=3.73 TRINITY_DN8892_c0_g1_i1:58-414(-)